MKTKLVPIGNLRGGRIPRPLLEQAGLEDEVELRASAQEGNPMGWDVPTWVERDSRDQASCGARLWCGITSAPLR